MLRAALAVASLLVASAAQGQEAPATLTGRLSYPSDGIPPDMRICAEAVATKQRICTQRKQKRGAVTRYELSVPPGSYLVFATTRDWTGPPAYYSEFVTCGVNVNCKSHKAITVTVKAGERRDGVDPGDWYAP